MADPHKEEVRDDGAESCGNVKHDCGDMECGGGDIEYDDDEDNDDDRDSAIVEGADDGGNGEPEAGRGHVLDCGSSPKRLLVEKVMLEEPERALCRDDGLWLAFIC